MILAMIVGALLFIAGFVSGSIFMLLLAVTVRDRRNNDV